MILSLSKSFLVQTVLLIREVEKKNSSPKLLSNLDSADIKTRKFSKRDNLCIESVIEKEKKSSKFRVIPISKSENYKSAVIFRCFSVAVCCCKRVSFSLFFFSWKKTKQKWDRVSAMHARSRKHTLYRNQYTCIRAITFRLFICTIKAYVVQSALYLTGGAFGMRYYSSQPPLMRDHLGCKRTYPNMTQTTPVSVSKYTLFLVIYTLATNVPETYITNCISRYFSFRIMRD